MIKKLGIKILAVIILVVAMNFVYTKWFYESDLQKHSSVINLVREIPENVDIIYIGESSNNTNRSDDIDKRRISEFIGDHFPGLVTYDITKPAGHAGIYKILLQNIPEEHNSKTVIVTLNLRSFDAQWIYSELETSLQKSMVLIRDNPPLLNRFLLSFKAYDIKSDKERTEQFMKKWRDDAFHMPYEFQFRDVIEWDQWMAFNGIKDENGNFDKEQTELACHYIKAYGFQLDTTNNPRIDDFNDIVELAKQRDWNMVFNLLAENTQKANELVGKDLVYMINENARILQSYYERKGVVVVNNINMVDDDQFVDQNWTTEHYAEKGRKIIAHNVAGALSSLFGDYYLDMNYKIADSSIKTRFFHDCESREIWGQMNTITTHIAWSGESSSQTGDGFDYSITLEYPFKNIPDSLKQRIDIDFWMYQKKLDHDSKLVIQADGKDFRHFWYGESLKDQVTEINVWQLYSTSFIVPDSIYNADLLKIYVYNPSATKIYIDDFSIKFLK